MIFLSNYKFFASKHDANMLAAWLEGLRCRQLAADVYHDVISIRLDSTSLMHDKVTLELISFFPSLLEPSKYIHLKKRP